MHLYCGKDIFRCLYYYLQDGILAFPLLQQVPQAIQIVSVFCAVQENCRRLKIKLFQGIQILPVISKYA